jgi:hypothetical protein
MVIAAVLSVTAVSATLAASSVASATSNRSPDLTSQGRWVTGGPIKFYTGGHVRIRRLWDGWNNCVKEDGTQHNDLAVKAGSETTRLGVTTVSSGQCWLERSKMHWEVALLDAQGKPTGNTADIGLSQGAPNRFLDYTWECVKTTGSMKCKHSDILGTNVGLSW